MGSSDSVAYSNQIVINGEGEKYAVFMYRGEDEPDVQGSDGRPRRNHIYNNELIADENTVKIMDSDDNIIEVSVMESLWCFQKLSEMIPCSADVPGDLR